MADKQKEKGPMTPEQCREHFLKMIGMEVYCDEPNRVVPENEEIFDLEGPQKAAYRENYCQWDIREAEQKNRRRAWEFALGMIQTDGLVPTPDFMAVVERNIRGEISDDDILNYIKATYAEDCEVAEISKRLLEQNRAAYNILAGEQPQAGPIWDEDTQKYI